MIKDVWSRQISLANDKYRITSHVNLFYETTKQT